MTGLATDNLPFATIVDEILGNFGGNTRRISVDRLVALLAALMGPTYATRAELFADLGWPSGSIGYVRDDATTAYNGVYKKSGASGSGSWTRIGDLPSGAVEVALIDAVRDLAQASIAASPLILTNVGGTPSAMTADIAVGLGLSTVPVGMPVILRAVGVNPGPVTLEINGMPERPILDGRGRQLVGGELTGATPLMLRPSGDDGAGGPTEYRIMSSLVHPADMVDAAAARELGQVLRLNNVTGADAITADLASEQAPAALANDTKVLLVPAGDNTIGDVPLDFGFGPHLIKDPEGGVLLPRDLKLGVPVMLRHSTFGGGQWRIVDGVARARPAVVVNKAVDQVNIYLHQTGDIYIHLRVIRTPDPTRNSDVWRIDRIRQARANSRTSYSTIAEITTVNSEIEQVIYLIGAADAIGGLLHGNEEVTDFGVSLDGEPLTDNGWYAGRELVMTQTSNGFLPGATSGTRWEPKGPHILTNQRTWRISTYPATIDIANEVTQHAAGHVVNRGYVGMLPMLAANADVASNWPYTDQRPVAPGSDILSDAHRTRIWGSAYWGDVQVIEGWDAPNREMRVKLDSAPVGKVYPDAWRGLVSAVDGVWRARTVLRFGLTGDQGVGLGAPATAGDIAAEWAARGLALALARLANADVLAVAALADERAQAAAATANLNRETIQTLLSRLAALEAGNKEETEMTSYPVSITATASPSVVIAEGPVQLIELYNHSDSVRIGLSFGTPAATFGASHYTLHPGGATDPKLIFSTPIYAITDGGEAKLNGAFGTPLNNPNPNWEGDFQDLMGRLGGGASLAWIEAYRRLYSALRRDKVLERVRGFYALAGHSQQAMLVNWAAENSATIGSGAPVFTPKQGVLFNGASHLDTGVSMGALGVTTTTASAGVWPGFEDQAIGAAALGDGVFELHPNRSPTEVGSRGWAASTSVDISASPGLGSFMGAVRVAQPNFTVYVGGSGEIETRDYTSGYPVRPVFIGATNQSTGVGKHYSGLIRGAMFGLSLSAVQMLAARSAMARFFKDIEAA